MIWISAGSELISHQQNWKAFEQPKGWTSLDSSGRSLAKLNIYLDSLNIGKIVQLLRGPGQRSVGDVAWGVVALQNGLSSRRSAPIEQLPGDHRRHRRLGRVGSCPTELFGVVSLIGSYSLCNLRDHGKNSSRKLLMAEIRHPKLIFFITWEERGAHWRAAVCESSCRHTQAPKVTSEKNN